MARMEHETEGRRHPLIDEAAARLRSGQLSRRAFLRLATLLGAGAGAAALAADRLAPGDDRMARNFAADSLATGATPHWGGVLRCAMRVLDVSDPALFDWVEKSNITRHQNEYLTITGPDNITRPMLAARWAASNDLKTWTFFLRQGVRWHNGDKFTAQDVAFNFERWLDSRNGSSNLGLFGALAEPVDTGRVDSDGKPILERRAGGGAVEIVDETTVRLHLSSPVLSMPENLYNYPAAILHRGFEGDVARERNGTGAYQIVEHAPGEVSISRRVKQDGWRYWGAESPHVGPAYLDEIRYIHHETANAEPIQAMIDGEADMTYEIDADQLSLAHSVSGARVVSADTAQTGCIRMRMDAQPFNDWRVRRAVQLCCDPSVFPNALFGGRGRAAEHHHVAPLHPDYYPLPRPRRSVEEAKRLLSVAGFTSGVDLTLDVGNTSGVWQQHACELLRDQAAEAGVRINVNVMPAADYLKVWNTTPFGLTQWVHRPLGTMALSLGYRSGVPWNETGYSNPEFDAALTEAEALIDITARRKSMKPVEEILQRDAVMVQPVWVPVFFLASEKIRGLAAAPTQHHQFNKVWIES